MYASPACLPGDTQAALIGGGTAPCTEAVVDAWAGFCSCRPGGCANARCLRAVCGGRGAGAPLALLPAAGALASVKAPAALTALDVRAVQPINLANAPLPPAKLDYQVVFVLGGPGSGKGTQVGVGSAEALLCC